MKDRFSKIAGELKPHRLMPSLTAGLIVGIIEVLIAVSFAALIFSGPMDVFVARGIGLALVGAALHGVIVAMFSSLPGTVSGNQDVPVAILAIMVAGLANQMPPEATAADTYLTAVAVISLSTLLTGALFFGLGQFRLGALVRFLPYPVIGGFLAGTGWLLVTGGLGMMVNRPVTIGNLAMILDPLVLPVWLPGVAFALALSLVLLRSQSSWTLPVMILGGTALFYLVLWMAGLNLEDAASRGWLLGPFPSRSLWEPLALADLARVNWGAISGQAANLASLLLISSTALLLNASGLELATRKDMDLNQELRVGGYGNIAVGLVAGIVGFQQLSLSVLNIRMGANNRLPGLIAAGICGLAVFFGASAFGLFPKVVVGGLLISLGLSFLWEWVFQAWSKLPRPDYVLVLLILGVIVTAGFLEGVGLGILAAAGLFILKYSRINVIRHAFDGTTYQSSLTRPKSKTAYLRRLANRIMILELQGFIFFGTAYSLLEKVRARLAARSPHPVEIIVLDFKHVTGIDSSAMLSFSRMKHLAESHQLILVLTDLSEEAQNQLERAGILTQDQAIVGVFADLDRGLEWCESRLLRNSGVADETELRSFEDQLASLLKDSGLAQRVLPYLEPLELPAKHPLITQGDTPDSLYFIAHGQVTAYYEGVGSEAVRLQSMTGENVVGEIGLYLGGPRTASVLTDVPSILYCLSGEALERMEDEDPGTAARFHRCIAGMMAERIVHLTRKVDAALR